MDMIRIGAAAAAHDLGLIGDADEQIAAFALYHSFAVPEEQRRSRPVIRLVAAN